MENNPIVKILPHSEMIEVLRYLAAYAFRPSPLPTLDEWRADMKYMNGSTHAAVFENEQAQASAACDLMMQSIRGQLFRIGAVWGVSTAPSARRKGYAKLALRHLLTWMRTQQMAFSALYPFRESFYERLGYVTFPQAHIATITIATLVPLLKMSLPGEVERMEIGAGYDIYRSFLYGSHISIHGMGLFNEDTSIRLRDKNEFWLAIARVDGVVKGVMLYKIDGYGGTMEVPVFYYSDSLGRFLLLEYLARHIDQIKEVELRLRPDERPETWFSDLKVQIRSIEPTPMARIVDVEQIEGISVGEGQFTARISDPFCDWNEGSYRFESRAGSLHVTPCEATISTDCHLTIQALSSLIYGTHNPEMFQLRGWGDPDPALQTILRSMFPPANPDLFERF